MLGLRVGFFLLIMQVCSAIAKEVDVINNAGQSIGKASVVVTEKGSVLRVNLLSMSPGWHGMHLHVNPDCSDPQDGFLRSGGHLNLHHKQHGILSEAGAHTGDLANIYVMPACQADKEDQPRAVVEQWLPWISADRGIGSVALVIHEHADDYTTNPTGDAGKRLACAVLMIDPPLQDQ